ncbi:unnamed protein product [Amoebophrya sp. A120]|nr:unnamed protein product [Amoebophrya sp. A120]|eukprot:GSA120T00002449001.1
MLLVSESDSQNVVVSLSEGKFGVQTGLPVAATPAPKPACANGFGTFAKMVGKTECVAPASLVPSLTGVPDPDSTQACSTAKSAARVRARFTLTEQLPTSITSGEQLLQETGYVNAKKRGIANSLPGATEDNVLITGFDVVSARRNLERSTRALATASRSVTTHFEVTDLDSDVATSIEADLAASSVRTALATQITAQMTANPVTVAGETVSVTSTSATGVTATADSGTASGAGADEDDDDIWLFVVIAGVGVVMGMLLVLVMCRHKLCGGAAGKTAPQSEA